MVQKICPRCKRVITTDIFAGDYVHDCDSGDSTIDNEDIVRIDVANWNLQGVANAASTKARIKGANIDSRTSRGNRVATHRTRQHQQYIKIEGNDFQRGD